jgi:hypothetical protein
MTSRTAGCSIKGNKVKKQAPRYGRGVVIKRPVGRVVRGRATAGPHSLR